MNNKLKYMYSKNTITESELTGFITTSYNSFEYEIVFVSSEFRYLSKAFLNNTLIDSSALVHNRFVLNLENNTNNELVIINLFYYENLSEVSSIIAISFNIESVNLSGLSGLTNLDLRNNNLTTLDISDQTNLNTLRINGNGNFNSIDLSNQNLTTLAADNFMFNTINLSSHTNLVSLSITSSSLQSIVLPSNSNISTLFLFSNNLNTLDLNGQTNLNDIRIQFNNFTSQDITNMLSDLNASLFDGSFNYGNVTPTSDAQDDYNDIINRGGTITGNPPI